MAVRQEGSAGGGAGGGPGSREGLKLLTQRAVKRATNPGWMTSEKGQRARGGRGVRGRV